MVKDRVTISLTECYYDNEIKEHETETAAGIERISNVLEMEETFACFVSFFLSFSLYLHLS